MRHWADLQSERNFRSRAAWETFAEHRARLQAELHSACELAGVSGGRLCVLGAGNCNDLDLSRLTAQFSAVHLVDLDAAALAHAIAEQSAAAPQCVLHAGVDLTGISAVLADLHTPASEAEVSAAQFSERLAAHLPPLPGPFDAVLAAGVLSQVIESAAASLGSDHPRLPALATELRDQHVRQVLAWTRPGGAALIAIDFVSSETAPALGTATTEQLPALARQLLQAGNFFLGCHPFALWEAARTDPRAAEATLTPPWTWSLGSKTMLVTALRIRRSSAPA